MDDMITTPYPKPIIEYELVSPSSTCIVAHCIKEFRVNDDRGLYPGQTTIPSENCSTSTHRSDLFPTTSLTRDQSCEFGLLLCSNALAS
jgi:hypothetical protein